MFCDVEEYLIYNVTYFNCVRDFDSGLQVFLFLFVQINIMQLIVIKWKLNQDNCSLFLCLYTVEVAY